MAASLSFFTGSAAALRPLPPARHGNGRLQRIDPCAASPTPPRSLHNPSRLVVRAAKLPSGVDPPKEEPKLSTPLLGFTDNAERWNSRAAMIGLFGLFFFELIIQKGFLELIGFEVGKGINIPL